MLIYLLHLLGEKLVPGKMSIIYRKYDEFSILGRFEFHGFRI